MVYDVGFVESIYGVRRRPRLNENMNCLVRLPVVPAIMLFREHRSKVAGVVVGVVPVNVVNVKAAGQELVMGEFPDEVRLLNGSILISVRVLGAGHESARATVPVGMPRTAPPEHRVSISASPEHQVLVAAKSIRYLRSADAAPSVPPPTRFDRVSHSIVILQRSVRLPQTA